MGYESPDVILYDVNGNQLAVQNATAIPSSTPALLIAGSDGTNSRYITIDSSGRSIVAGAGTAGTPAGGVLTIQGVSGGTVIPVSITGTNTISGTVTANIGTTGGLALDATLAKLTITQGTALGTNTVTMMGGSVTTAAPTYTTGNINPLSLTTAGALRIDGSAVTQPVSGTVTANAGTGNFAVVQSTASNLNATVVGSGNFTVVQSTAASLRAQTAAESATGAAPPATGILIAGSVTTAAPSYTTGQMSALSLTTGGLLRVDGSGVTQPVSGTVAATQSGTWTVQPGNTANTTPWLTKISDGTNSPSIKAASTAAVVGDPSLVVAISPNTSIAPDVITTSTNLNALNATVVIAPNGRQTIGFQTYVATLVGSIVAEFTVDGSNWYSTYFDINQSNAASGKTNIITFTTTGQYAVGSIIGVGGAAQVRIRVSVYTSGSSSAYLRASTVYDPSVLYGASIASTVQSPVISQIGGWVTTAAPTYTTGTANIASLTTAGALRTDSSSWLGSTAPTVGQKTMSASIPVTIASDQSTLTVTSTSLGNADTITSGTITATDAVVGAPNGTGGIVTGASTAGSYIAVAVTGGDTTWNTYFGGTYGGGTIYFEISFTSSNGVNGDWFPVAGRRVGQITTDLAYSATGLQTAYRGDLSGATYFRVRMIGATAPSLTVYIRLSSGSGPVFLDAPLPAGVNTIGNVNAIQSGTWTVQPGNTANTTPWLSKLSDGTNAVAIKAASTAPLATDPALVVSISPNSSISSSGVNDGYTSGTFSAGGQFFYLLTQGKKGFGANFFGNFVGTIRAFYSIDGGVFHTIGTYFIDRFGNKYADYTGTLNNLFLSVVAPPGATTLGIQVISYTSGSSSYAAGMSDTDGAQYTLYDVPDGTTTSAIALANIGGLVGTSAPTYVNGQYKGISLNTSGEIRVDLGDDSIVSGTFNAGSQTLNLPLHGKQGAGVRFTGTLSCSVNAFVSFNNGINSVATYFIAPGTGQKIAQLTGTIDGSWSVIIPGGATNLILTTASYVSGSSTYVATATNTAGSNYTLFDQPDGATLAPPTNAMIGGLVSTSNPTYTNGQYKGISLNTLGELRVIEDSTTANFATGSVGALNANVTLTLNGQSGAAYEIGAGLTGTIKAQYSVDGTNYTADCLLQDTINGTIQTTQTLAGTGSARMIVVPGGATAIRVIVSSYTSGSATIKLSATKSVGAPVQFAGPVNTAAGVPTVAAYIGGKVEASAGTLSAGALGNLSITTNSLLRVDGSNVTQPISASSLPLPTGAATESTLSAVSGKIILPSSLVGGRLDTNVGSWLGSTSPTIGSKLSVNSIPVVIASDQATVSTNDASNGVAQSTATALAVLGATVSIGMGGYDGVIADFTSAGTLNGTIIAEVLSLAGWRQTHFFDPTTTTAGLAVAQLVFTGAVAGQIWGIFVPAGITNVRLRVSAYTSGTTTAQLFASKGYNIGFDLTSGKIGGGLPIAATQIAGSVTTAAPTYTNGTINTLSLTTGGLLRVDSSGTTQPVSGTITANQGGTWNITNISGTVSLPTGAATETSLAKLTLAQGSTTSGQTGSLNLAAVTTAAPSYTTGQSSPLSLTTAGSLRIDNTSWLGSTAPTVGSKTSANSVPVVIASDQATINVNDQSGTPNTVSGTITAVNDNVILHLSGQSAISVFVTGTFVGTLQAQAEMGTSGGYGATSNCYFRAIDGTVSTTLSLTGTNVTRSVVLPSGAIGVRLIVTAATSGSSTLFAITSNAGFNDGPLFAGPTAGSLPLNVSYMGGSVTTAAPTYTTGTVNGLSLTTGGLLRVDSSGTTQPISGTVAATQSGTWTVQPGNTANTTPWLTKISDGTNAVAIKAASTAPVATDPAAVVTISPNSAWVADTTVSGTLNAVSATVIIPVSGHKSCGFQLAFSAYVGTVVVEASVDGGTTYSTATNTVAYFDANGIKVPSYTNPAGTQTLIGSIVGVGGATHYRLRCTAFTSGTATGRLTATNNDASSILHAGDIATFTQPPQASQVGGWVTTSAPTYTTATFNALSLTTGGLLRVDSSGTTQSVSQSGTWTVQPGNTANTTPWLTKLGDGTNNVAIKAASTAAVATDPALVVTISPNIGTILVQDTTALTDNSAFVDSTSKVFPNGYIFDEVAGTALTENDVAAARVDSKRSQIFTLEDSTTRGTRATIKAASTAAVGTDTALVVAVSPNNSIAVTQATAASLNATVVGTTAAGSGASSGLVTVQGNASGTPIPTTVNQSSSASGTLGALNATLNLNLDKGAASVAIQVTAGLNGTIQARASFDGGTTWVNTSIYTVGAAGVTSYVLGGSALGAGYLDIPSGANVIQIIVAAYTSGSAVCTMTSNASPFVGKSPRVIYGGLPTLGTNDPAMAVAIHPSFNNVSVSGLTDNNFTSAGFGSGSTASLQISNIGSSTFNSGIAASVTFSTGFAGTAVTEISYDNTNWISTYFSTPNGAKISVLTVLTTGTTAGIIVPVGTRYVRVRGTSGSGTTTMTLYSSTVPDNFGMSTAILNTAAPLAANLVGGQSGGVIRSIRTNRIGHIRAGFDTMLIGDSVEGSTVNSIVWTQATTTMTIGQATGVITLNSSSTLTTTTNANLVTNKQLMLMNHGILKLSFRASVTQGPTNAVIELGMGSPSGSTATISNGAFFRLDGTSLRCVTSFNGTENSVTQTATLTNSTYYMFYIYVDEASAKFIIEDVSGIPILDTSVAIPSTTAFISATTHLPAFARVRNAAAVASAAQLRISSFDAFQFDFNAEKPWADQLAGTGRSSNINPTTFAQTMQLAAGAAPTATTPTNTAVAYTTLGGEFVLNATASSENLLGVFGYTVPSPYSFVITDIMFPPPVITTTMGAAVSIHEYALMVGNSTNPSTATGQRYALGMYTAASAAAAGTVFSGQALNPSFRTPIVVQPGQVLLVLVKAISGIATGVYRGSIFINGYYE